MGKQTLTINKFQTAAPDLDWQSKGGARGMLRELRGMETTAPIGPVNKAVSSPGSDLLTNKPLQRALIQGATGQTSENFFTDSEPDSMTLFILAFPEIRGNIIGNVLNGNGTTYYGESSGHQGEGISVYQETWGDKSKINIGVPAYSPDQEPLACPASAPVLIPYFNDIYVAEADGSPSDDVPDLDDLLAVQFDNVPEATSYDIYVDSETALSPPYDPVTVVASGLDPDVGDTTRYVTDIVLDWNAGFSFYIKVVAKKTGCADQVSSVVNISYPGQMQNGP